MAREALTPPGPYPAAAEPLGLSSEDEAGGVDEVLQIRRPLLAHRRLLRESVERLAVLVREALGEGEILDAASWSIRARALTIVMPTRQSAGRSGRVVAAKRRAVAAIERAARQR